MYGKLTERFLKYIEVETGSERGTESKPSNLRQFDLIHLLAYELQQLGISEIHITNWGNMYAKIPASAGFEDKKKIGFVTHLDTYPDFKGKVSHPNIIGNYNGEDVKLGLSGKVLRVSSYPDLVERRGQTLITTDGSSILGVDGKAGIAEVMNAVEVILTEELPHGEFWLAFVSDEEIGEGATYFEKEKFPVDGAYAVEGWNVGEIINETFNAAKIVVDIKGHKTHNGRAKGRLVNAQLIGMEINSRLPEDERPENTEQREGFYHLRKFDGGVENARMFYEIRDLNTENFRKRIRLVEDICKEMDEKHERCSVKTEVSYTYANVKEILDDHSEMIEMAVKATKANEVEPILCAARGGTMGSRLTYMDIPCPTIGMGGDGYHGVYEHITVEATETVSQILVDIIRKFSELGT
ncbi:MAG: peptidase T, partial [Dorea sp.]|nr:peptidase T [Dorea sp.]